MRAVFSLTVLLFGFCLPAVADSYAIATFDDGQTTYPFASFYPGTAGADESGNYLFDCGGNGAYELDCFIKVTPGFSVHEIRFDLNYEIVYSVIPYTPGVTIDINQAGSEVYDEETVTTTGPQTLDFKEPFAISSIELYEGEPGLVPDATLDNVAFNPSLAPTATTPEPPTALLLAPVLLVGAALRRRKAA